MSESQRVFRPGVALSAQVAVALVTVLALATWQFSRGLDKRALASERSERLGRSPVDIAMLTPDTPDFTRVALHGSYDPEQQFFVVGRGAGRVQAWSTLRGERGAFLVNRGWFGSPDAPPGGPVSVVGVVWPSAQAPVYVAQQRWPGDWPKTIRVADPLRMAEAAGTWPREVRLERGSAGVLQPMSLGWDYSAGMHWGYTAQWLLLGAAVVVGYVIIGYRRGNKERR